MTTFEYYGHIDIAKAFLEIDEKFKAMEKFTPHSVHDVQISGTFPQYMVVFISRTTEGCIKEIIFNKCRLKSCDKIYLDEVQQKLKEFQNPTKEQIYSYFDDLLNIELEDKNFNDKHFTALGQILKDRHKIAHSQRQHPFLSTDQYLKSLEDIKKHYENVKDFVSKLCELTDSN